MAKGYGIINKIMASSTSAVILMTDSDAEHIGFLSELFNFYRHTFYFCADYDNVESLSMELARRVFADDEEEYLKILQFKHCEFGVNKNNIIINCVLNKIASLNGDCLLVIDSLEKLGDKFDYSHLGFLLANCPRNLKVILISSNLIYLDYNSFPRRCPKMFDKTDLPVSMGSVEEIMQEKLTEEQLSFIAYVSSCGNVDGEFADEIFSGGKNLLNYLSKKYPYLIFKKGDDLFCFATYLHDELIKLLPSLGKNALYNADPKLLLIEHLCETERPIKAMKLALDREDYAMLDSIIRRFSEEGKYFYMLAEYAKVLGEESLRGGIDYGAVKLLIALCRYYKNDYKRAAQMAEDVIASSERNTFVELFAHRVRYRCFYKQGQYRQAVEYARELVKDRVLNNERIDPINLESILFSLPDAIKKYDAYIEINYFRLFAKVMSNPAYRREYWYPRAMQALAEVYIELGDYGRANEIIEDIKKLLPFYVLPYKLMTFRYYVGDMHVTYELAKTALAFTERAGKNKDLTELYFLLAKTEVYFNKYDEALSYLERAIASASDDDPDKYLAIAYKIAIFAKIGKAEWGLDLATLYIKICETYSAKAVTYLLCAKAYCYYRLGDKDDALLYARMCLSKASVRSQMWYLSDAISIDILLERGALSDEEITVGALLESCSKYRKMAVIVDYYDCFKPIIEFAERNSLAPKVVEEVTDLLRKKDAYNSPISNVVVKLMGNTSVMVEGAELIWKTRKAKELFLAYVIAGKEGLDRNFILSNFWNDYLYESAINNLKTTNNMIRNSLNEKNVDYKLRYGNGKYTLEVTALSCDYPDFLTALDSFDENAPLAERTAKIWDIINKYNGGFATDATHDYFRRIAKTHRDRIIVSAIKVVNDMIDNNDRIGAKRLNNALRNIDREGEYASAIVEQKEKLNSLFERN